MLNANGLRHTDPVNYLLQRYHAGRIAGICAMIWGILMLGIMVSRRQ